MRSNGVDHQRVVATPVTTPAPASGAREAVLRGVSSLALTLAGTAAAASSVALAVAAFLIGAGVLVFRPRVAAAAAVLLGAIVMCELAMTHPEAQQVIHYLH